MINEDLRVQCDCHLGRSSRKSRLVDSLGMGIVAQIITGLSLAILKRMPRWFTRLQVATACFSCSPPELNILDPYFIFMLSLFHIYVHE
jgi:hypothetical protein